MAEMEAIKKIIHESGNNFHCKVLKHLKENGWYTLVSPYYTDFVTDKPREIDIVAEKSFSENSYMTKGNLNVKLYIECKYISQDMVFWFSDKDNYKAKKWVLDNTPITENNIYFKKHHYNNESNNKVAKLFASNTKKQVENETIYKAINQCLNALVYNKNSYSIIPNQKHSIYQIIHYPIIICNSFDKFYKVEMDGNNEPEKIEDNFQLEINYAYLDYNKKSRNQYFLIDFVEFKRLDEILSTIQMDVEAITNFIWNL